jgi:CHAD domain-containing protein
VHRSNRPIDLAETLRGGVRRFCQLVRQTAHHPTTDHVHDLRVLTRKLRADLWLVPTSARSRAIRRARHDLQRLAAVLGRQRECDVALEDAVGFGRDRNVIERRLGEARQQVIRCLRPKKRTRYIKHLQHATRDVSSLDTHVVLSQVRHLQDRLQRAMNHPPTTNRARHRLRINVKKARYMLEATRRPVTSLVKLQDHLGRWHDLMVLSSVAGRTSRVTRARIREWMIARRLVRPALRQAIHSLSDLR